MFVKVQVVGIPQFRIPLDDLSQSNMCQFYRVLERSSSFFPESGEDKSLDVTSNYIGVAHQIDTVPLLSGSLHLANPCA